jgi:hypothetical protein
MTISVERVGAIWSVKLDNLMKKQRNVPAGKSQERARQEHDTRNRDKCRQVSATANPHESRVREPNQAVEIGSASWRVAFRCCRRVYSIFCCEDDYHDYAGLCQLAQMRGFPSSHRSLSVCNVPAFRVNRLLTTDVRPTRSPRIALKSSSSVKA